MKYLWLVFLLSACTKQESIVIGYTPSFIHKEGLLIANRMEGTPFVWNNELHYAISNRITSDTVEIYKDNNLISAVSISVALFSVYVNNSTLILIGSDGKTLKLLKTQDLINWSMPITIFIAPDQVSLFNTSLSSSPNGGYILAYETCELNTTCFNARFLTSTDLITWTPIGGIFHPEIYAACPTIRYADGYYYVFYLRSVGHFATYVSRSKDLINWEDSDMMVLSSMDSDTEGINNSDMDFVEYQGKVMIQYAVGNQSSNSDAWSNINKAYYNGTLTQFVKEFFK